MATPWGKESHDAPWAGRGQFLTPACQPGDVGVGLPGPPWSVGLWTDGLCRTDLPEGRRCVRSDFCVGTRQSSGYN